MDLRVFPYSPLSASMKDDGVKIRLSPESSVSNFTVSFPEDRYRLYHEEHHPFVVSLVNESRDIDIHHNYETIVMIIHDLFRCPLC